MLPEHLISSYTQYKRDTDYFVTWLNGEAEACGYKVNIEGTKNIHLRNQSQFSQARLKGRARIDAKLAKEKSNIANRIPTAKYALPTKELLVHARIVAESKRPGVKV
jgi:hypothetical protein